MKALYIIRHAKSSWDDPMMDDIDRPLNARGKRDAPRMGQRLKEKGVIPNLMITSHARRAYSTCKRIAQVIGYTEERIKSDKSLYHAAEDEILKIVQHLDDKHDVVIMVGHNPGLTDFVNLLLDEQKWIPNIPTCGIVAFRFDIKHWVEVSVDNGTFIFFDFPKSIITE